MLLWLGLLAEVSLTGSKNEGAVRLVVDFALKSVDGSFVYQMVYFEDFAFLPQFAQNCKLFTPLQTSDLGEVV